MSFPITPIRALGARSTTVRHAMLLLAVLVPLMASAQLAPQNMPSLPIRSVRELRSLSVEQTAAGLPVEIEGTLIFYQPPSLAFLQDSTGGTYVAPPLFGDVANKDAPPEPGDRFRLRGITSPGGFAPYIQNVPEFSPSAEYLGHGPLPAPIVVDSRLMFDTALESSWVQVTAVVRRLEVTANGLHLQLTDGTHEFSAVVSGDWRNRPLPIELTGANVRITGVFGVASDAKRRLTGMRIMVPSLEFVEVLDDGARHAFSTPPLSVEELFQYRPDPASRVHVRGVVTAAFPGEEFFMRVGDDPLMVRMTDAILPAPGEVVSVVGFPVLIGGTIAIDTATYKPVGDTRAVEPRPLALEGDPGLSSHGELVEIEIRLLDVFESGRELLYLVTDGSRTFPARLRLAEDTAAPNFKIDGWYVMTGICLVDTETVELPNATDPGFQSTGSFSLLLRNASDVQLLRAPPFWTTTRILVALATLGFAFGLVALWAAMLRRKVLEQTRVIHAKVESERVSEERARIARELHDSLEQELAGIGIQLDLARTRTESNPGGVRDAVDLALRMLRRVQDETRRSIQDLRDSSLLRAPLAESLTLLAERVSESSALTVVADVDHTQVNLPATVEHNLLRVAGEALHNAVKHAQAQNARIVFRTHADASILLEVSDDGRGFDPNRPRPGHFGLLGMRERALRVGARFVIDTYPGKGTRIRLHWKPEGMKK